MHTITPPVGTTAQPHRAQHRKGLGFWIGRILLGLVITLVAFAASGAIYQVVATAIDQRSYPPPGQLVDVGGYKLHINCIGPTNTGNPTVILEGGLGATSTAWAWIQPEVAETTRVCAYDRAGTGWSDTSAEPHDAQHIAKALHTLLHNANVASPYVLVGWSVGGLYVRAFADHYRTEVAGVVLLDSSSPDQCTSTPAAQARCDTTTRISAMMPVLARIGVMRVMSHFQPASSLPQPQSAEALAASSATKDWDTLSAEFLASPATYAQARASVFPAGVPLFVLTATDHDTPPDLEQLWQGWQNEMATLSTNRVHQVVVGAHHTSLVLAAKDAKASVAAIRQIVEAARTGKPLVR
jgi:pimeloyl-ACP methyl ester carboxylesterase